jgi:S-formylglutathione hydrolase FrmB
MLVVVCVLISLVLGCGDESMIRPDAGRPVPQAASMRASVPTVKANGVKWFSVTSVFQGPAATIVRVLEPTNPAPGKPHRFLYVLPVDSGVTSLASEHSDGLDELRLLNVHNRYNATLIAPSFHRVSWYGDHATDLNLRHASFIVKDLVPFGDSFAPPGEIPERWLIGFSKSGHGALTLILRNPDVFSAAAAWDAPAQFTSAFDFPGLVDYFGTEENFDRYEVPMLVVKSANPFRARNRLWISGDNSAWTSHMIRLHSQMVKAGVLHTWARGGQRAHSWNSGWLEGAVAALDANAAMPRAGSSPVAADSSRSGGVN